MLAESRAHLSSTATACSPAGARSSPAPTTASTRTALDAAGGRASPSPRSSTRGPKRPAMLRQKPARRAAQVLTGTRADRLARSASRISEVLVGERDGDTLRDAGRIALRLRPDVAAAGRRPCICSRSRAAGCASMPRRRLHVPGASAQRERSAGACAALCRSPHALRERLCRRRAGRGTCWIAHTFDVIARRDDGFSRRALPSAAGCPAAKAFVDFQNDVTAKDLQLAVREGFRSDRARQALHHDRHGDRPGQDLQHERAGGGRRPRLAKPVPEVGLTTFRPPYTPVTFGALAGPRRGELFDPVRRTPIDAWAEAQRRRVRGCRHLEARALFPDARRGHARRRRPRMPRRARAASASSMPRRSARSRSSVPTPPSSWTACTSMPCATSASAAAATA